jgi:hypothetical protein
MPRMPNIAREAAQAVWGEAEHAEEAVSDWFRRGDHPYASQAPAAATATVEAAPAAQPPEEDMSLLDTIKNGVAEAEAKLEGLDEEALALLKSVMANPEAAAVMKDLGGLASVVGLPPNVITGAAGALKTVLSLYPAEPVAEAPAPAPAAA